jgi:hypothetical protein
MCHESFAVYGRSSGRRKPKSAEGHGGSSALVDLRRVWRVVFNSKPNHPNKSPGVACSDFTLFYLNGMIRYVIGGHIRLFFPTFVGRQLTIIR